MTPLAIPRLRLTHGQVAWTLSMGQPPTKVVLAQLRYLRTLGIPFADAQRAAGRGNRVTYGFYDLIETGMAFEALRRGVPPRHLKQLVDERRGFRRVYKRAYQEIPEAAYVQSWVKSRGEERVLLGEEYFVYIEGRFSPDPGHIELPPLEEAKASMDFGDLVDRSPSGADRVVLQIKRLMIPLLAWAAEAPVTPPGPKATR
jgi:hypothetical protein